VPRWNYRGRRILARGHSIGYRNRQFARAVDGNPAQLPGPLLALDNYLDPLSNTGKVVVIGGSAGAVQALQLLISELLVGFPAPVVVVQHRMPTHQSLLAKILASRSRLPVVEAHEGGTLKSGIVYVSRPDRHLTINGYGNFVYPDGSRIRYVLSSANPLFESAAALFGAETIGVVLSGFGPNGTDGVQAIKARAGAVDHVLRIEDVAPMLVRLVTQARPSQA
jgi:two-component system, chemotaxis family, protein-glutamate methylesterase/glutaminase